MFASITEELLVMANSNVDSSNFKVSFPFKASRSKTNFAAPGSSRKVRLQFCCSKFKQKSSSLSPTLSKCSTSCLCSQLGRGQAHKFEAFFKASLVNRKQSRKVGPRDIFLPLLVLLLLFGDDGVSSRLTHR